MTDQKKQTMQEKVIKYLLTAMNAFEHVFIYKIAPKLSLLKAKCRSITQHIDTWTIIGGSCAFGILFLVFISAFVVDMNENDSSTEQIIQNNQDFAIPNQEDESITIAQTQIHSESDIIDKSYIEHQSEVISEYETIDNLFRPTPTLIHSENEQQKSIKFNEWIFVQSVDWKLIKKGQIVKIEDSKTNKHSTVRIKEIDFNQMNVLTEYINCYFLCHSTIDMLHSQNLIYLIRETEGTKMQKDTIYEDNDVNNEEIENMKTEQNEFREWVTSQFINLNEQSDNIKDSMTDYLDNKMDKLFQILEHQQNAINSIQINQQNDAYSHGDNNNESVRAEAEHFDWQSIEDQIDEKIESVISNQFESNFNILAQQIAQEIAKEFVSENENAQSSNGQIIKEYVQTEEDKDSKEDNHNNQRVDWSFRVVSHSKLKTNSKDTIWREYGYWIMHNLMFKWNQNSISPTYKPGDCTPLEFKQNSDVSYITIELYQAIKIRQISLYHYHSPVLSQRAINAAPKDFQVFASYNLTTWHDIGNFSYDYYAESNTQYFDVKDPFIKEEKESDEHVSNDENGIEVSLEDEIESDDENGFIVNGASMMTSNNESDVNAADYVNGFKFVAFRLLSNYGGSDYGCIYRLRVFGDVIS